MEITTGMYRHFKGDIYEVLGVGRHSETEEWLVVYRNAEGAFWVRPYDMFFDFVVYENAQVQRFGLIRESKTESEELRSAIIQTQLGGVDAD